MSKFTTEVRFICETLAGRAESAGGDNVNSIINTAAPLLFNFDFPIFDESYRLPLETKILRHYYTREICEETVGLWKLRLQDKLNMIMPYYNQLYRSELLQFNPLYDVSLSVTRNKTSEGEKSNTGSSLSNLAQNATNSKTNNSSINYTDTTTGNDEIESTSWDLYSDTPQGGINGIESGDVNGNYYLKDARKNTDSNQRETSSNSQHSETGEISSNLTNASTATNTVTTNTTSEITDTETYVEQISGKRGNVSYSKMIQDFRKTFLNIDKMVIEELEPLFFGLW